VTTGPRQVKGCGRVLAESVVVVSQSAVVGIFLVALALVLTPGPNMLYLVSRSITQGRRAGVISLGGVAAGFGVYLTATNLGLTAIFTHVPQLYLALRIAGAGYLAWLAFQALRPGGLAVFAPAELPPDSPRRLFAMGMMTNLLNPKVAVLYLSLIPQFVHPDDGHVLVQGFILGGVQIVVALTGNLIILLAAGTLADFFATRPGWLRVQRYLMGSVLGLLAIKIATDRARPAG